AGDLAVMYTDGFSEALNLQEDEWGTDPLRKIVREATESEDEDEPLAKTVKGEIVRQAFEHMGTAVQFDDMCLVIIQRTEDAVGGVPRTQPAAAQSDDDGPQVSKQSETINELDINDTLPADLSENN
ncbi:MAG: SpoIIE family protein phosphatase, partial [Rhodopirellula bahusiensis]